MKARVPSRPPNPEKILSDMENKYPTRSPEEKISGILAKCNAVIPTNDPAKITGGKSWMENKYPKKAPMSPMEQDAVMAVNPYFCKRKVPTAPPAPPIISIMVCCIYIF